jgi:AraC-like DNA-binding protein
MTFTFEGRSSDSPLVETIYHTRSEGAGSSFMSVAATHWEMVVTKQYGQVTLSIRGPETQATRAAIPENAEFLGIVFKHGAFMPNLPVHNLVNGGLNLPQGAGKTFWLNGSVWQFPEFENVDTFINRLVRQDMLAFDPVIGTVLQNRPYELGLTPRSVRRHFLRAMGLTHGSVVQIQRAHQAVALLESGVSLLDAAYLAGYADQPHMTRALKQFTGQTPAQILRAGGINSPVSNLELPVASPLLQTLNLSIA